MRESRRRYFAYGSNLVRAQMTRRCPAAREVGIAVLPGWRFAINRSGYATLLPDTGGAVTGLVWLLTRRCERALDAYEGVERGLYRKYGIEIGGEAALTYIARDPAPGLPRTGYLEAIIAAAEALGFPPLYIEGTLRRWLSPGA